MGRHPFLIDTELSLYFFHQTFSLFPFADRKHQQQHLNKTAKFGRCNCLILSCVLFFRLVSSRYSFPSCLTWSNGCLVLSGLTVFFIINRYLFVIYLFILLLMYGLQVGQEPTKTLDKLKVDQHVFSPWKFYNAGNQAISSNLI